MKAVTYTTTGDPDVLVVVERDLPQPGAGEARIRVVVSGVNPTDWKSRRGAAPGPASFPVVVPHHDGAGVIDALGPGTEGWEVGQRVWIYEAAWLRPDGTAQEFVVLPVRLIVPLPDEASFDLGACLGVPALTAHRCLTVAADGPRHVGPGSLSGKTVLVAGGAGAVGNATIQLARWAGATVLATASGPDKAALASRAGAHHTVDYRSADASDVLRSLAPGGVDLIIEVAAGVNAALDVDLLAEHGTVAVYGNDGGDLLQLPIRRMMLACAQFTFVVVLKVPEDAKRAAVRDVAAAVEVGALSVGEEVGLPLHYFGLEQCAQAHEAVEGRTVGRVLLRVG